MFDHDKLLHFILDTAFDDLPEGVLARARGCFLDLMCALVLGSRSRQFHAGLKLADAVFPPGALPILGSEKRGSLLGATCALAHASNAFDIDDGHNMIRAHPGTAVIPGVLAAALAQNASFKELLTALIIAYEIAVRSGLCMVDYYGFYHGSGAIGAMGAAAGMGRLLALSPSELRHALHIAEFNAPLSPGVLSAVHPSMCKDGVPFGAITAALSVYSAQGGFEGGANLLDLPENAPYLKSLGEQFEIMNLYFKPYTCCRWAHPAIDACLSLQKAHGIDHSAIKAVTIKTFRAATLLSQGAPKNTDEAQYNISYPVAAALVHGDCGFLQVFDDYLFDPDVLSMMEKLQITYDRAIDRQFPRRRICIAEIACLDGRVFTSQEFEPKGEAEEQIDFPWLKEKALRLTAPVLTPIGQERLLALCSGSLDTKVRAMIEAMNEKPNWQTLAIR